MRRPFVSSCNDPGVGDRVAAVFPAILVCGAASVPVLVATGVAPHWFWIFF